MNIRKLIRNSSAVIVAFLCLLISTGAVAKVPESNRSLLAKQKIAPGLAKELEAVGLVLGAPIFVRIFKEEAILEVWVENENQEYQLFKAYPICTFSGRLGPKLRTGDNQAPEGFYFVNAGRMNPWSRFHLSFNVGYPNRYDRHYGRTGSALMVHGNCVSIGCYAMTDSNIEEIYSLANYALNNGQGFFRVHIFPFKLTDQRLKLERGNQWHSFWKNLQEGYDHFVKFKRPPNVEVVKGRYVFNDT